MSRCSVLFGAVSRSRACWRGVCRFLSSVVSSISVCASGQHVCCATLDATCSLAQGTQQGSQVILSFAPILTCHFIITLSLVAEHPYGCCWVMVSMEYATGEMSGYWYCGEVTQTWPLWMRSQEMDPNLLKRPSSTRCNCWNGSAQEMREWITLQTAKLEAVVQGTMTQQASMTQGQVRSSESLVDTKLVTKQNAFSGEQDGQERWRTWSFMMRAYRAAHVTKTVLHLERVVG